MSMSRAPNSPKGRQALDEITTRLGSLMNEVKNAFEQGQAATQGKAENTREFSIDTPAGPLKGMASFRMGSLADRAGAGGASPSRDASQHEVKRKPAATSATRPAAKPAAEMADAREPMVDLFDEQREILIVAELPGVKPDEVTVTLEDSAVIISTSGARRFRAVRALPCTVDEASLSRAMRNGILEVRLTKIATDNTGAQA